MNGKLAGLPHQTDFRRQAHGRGPQQLLEPGATFGPLVNPSDGLTSIRLRIQCGIRLTNWKLARQYRTCEQFIRSGNRKGHRSDLERIMSDMLQLVVSLIRSSKALSESHDKTDAYRTSVVRLRRD